MNIITNKDIFAEKNQENILKKVDRRKARSKKSPTDSIKSAAAAANATKTPRAKETEESTPNKTVFYQASKPRTNQSDSGRPAFTSSPRTAAAATSTPSTSSAQSPVKPHTESTTRPVFTPKSVAEQGSVPPLPGNGRFTTAPRRPGRNQRFPHDAAGSFMKSSTAEEATPVTQSTPKPARVAGGPTLKIIPLGGLEEIGKNMTVLEYGNDIVIIDMGFMFPDSDMLGIDYIIPDVTYLEDKKDKIRGAIITHGHLDHTGAIPYIVQKLGFPTLYGTAITMGMAKGRLEEFGLAGKNKIVAIQPEKDVLQLGVFTIRPFRLMHSIPGAIGLEIETPNGRIAYCTDWKFDYTPASGEQIDFRSLAAIGTRGVDLLFSDSTNVDRPGHSISEKVVESSLNTAIADAKGRVIIAMFSSDLNRVQMTLNAAARTNRKVLVLGRSMQQNVEMAIGLKAINVPANTIISEREANRFNDNQLLVLSTGAQGEDRSALYRMASGDHRVVKIKKGDTVILSASPIPGNERAVSGVMDKLYKAGASVIYNKIMDTHTSGHAYQEDLKLMLALMKPEHFVPLHGERARLILHGKLAEEVGVKPENIIIGDNGLILEMDSTGKVTPTDNHVPAGYVMVDGLGVGDVGNIVLRDRQAMAQEGMFCIFCVVDRKTKKLMASPDIISRGFIYMRENEQFVNEIRTEIKTFLTKALASKTVDISQVRNDLRDVVTKLIHGKTERAPMVIPVISEV